MTAGALYNDADPARCAWVEELIRRGLVAPGDVWCRDIKGIRPDEISGFTQFHAFCGVAVWSYALRLAGWPDDRPVWTGSCPCQPFSAAGRRRGLADERHLWPAWFHLVGQCRPDVILGEQVESDDGLDWLDVVWTDLEALGYAFGPVVLPAAGVGAPHARHRIWFVAESHGERREMGAAPARPEARRHARIAVHGIPGFLGHADGARPQGRPRPDQGEGDATRRAGPAGGVADAERDGGRGGRSGATGATAGGVPGTDGQRQRVRPDAGPVGRPLDGDGRPGPLNGFWRDADWLRCRDGRWRPVRPGSFPLVDGTAGGVVPGGDRGASILATPEARAMRLQGYGDGLCAPAAEAFIRAYMDVSGSAAPCREGEAAV